MALPLHPDDVPHLVGDPYAVRAAARDIRSTAADLATTRVAAVRLAEIGSGVHWSGGAFAAFRLATERKPLVPAVDHAADRMAEAAERLDWFAAHFERNAERIRWCRSRLASLGLAAGDPPPELLPYLQAIAHEADDARRAHRSALDALAATFDRLDDEPTFATPPPSNWDRVRGYVADGARGLTDAAVELATLGFTMSLYTNPVTAPWKLRELWEDREQVIAVLQFAHEHPGEFAGELGKAVIDLDSWTEEGVAYWVGKRIPDIALSMATAGVGAAAPAAVGVARSALAATRFGAKVVPLLDDAIRVERAIVRVVDRIPTDLAERWLSRIPVIDRASSASQAATRALVLGEAEAFTGSQRVALASILGVRGLAQVDDVNDLSGAASELPR